MLESNTILSLTENCRNEVVWKRKSNPVRGQLTCSPLEDEQKRETFDPKNMIRQAFEIGMDSYLLPESSCTSTGEKVGSWFSEC